MPIVHRIGLMHGIVLLLSCSGSCAGLKHGPSRSLLSDDPGDEIVVDPFDAFDPHIWFTQCSGCTYSGGALLISGGDMLMRTVGTLTGLNRIEATIVKDEQRDDHAIAFSTRPNMPWRWGTSPGDVRFVWEGDVKKIIGQVQSTSVTCSGLQTYQIDIVISSSSVSMEDNWCGTLIISESLGSTTALYVYVGADADSSRGVSDCNSTIVKRSMHARLTIAILSHNVCRWRRGLKRLRFTDRQPGLRTVLCHPWSPLIRSPSSLPPLLGVLILSTISISLTLTFGYHSVLGARIRAAACSSQAEKIYYGRLA